MWERLGVPISVVFDSGGGRLGALYCGPARNRLRLGVLDHLGLLGTPILISQYASTH